jgi:hypothetical protein
MVLAVQVTSSPDGLPLPTTACGGSGTCEMQIGRKNTHCYLSMQGNDVANMKASACVSNQACCCAGETVA